MLYADLGHEYPTPLPGQLVLALQVVDGDKTDREDLVGSVLLRDKLGLTIRSPIFGMSSQSDEATFKALVDDGVRALRAGHSVVVLSKEGPGEVMVKLIQHHAGGKVDARWRSKGWIPQWVSWFEIGKRWTMPKKGD